MKRFIIAIGITTVFFGLAVQHASAAILPACDQTVYLLPEKVGVDCVPATRKGCVEKTPEQYDHDYSTQELREKNPAIVTINKACGFNDFVQLFINLANWGMGIMALLALGFAVWGGYTLMESAGSQEKIKEGKQTIWGGVLGITIVLTSWLLIGFVTAALTGTGPTVFKDAAGGKFARNFFGGSNCNSKFRDNCSYNALELSCKDTKQNGDAVTTAQSVLANLGCYGLAVDGCFGSKTQKAVKDFQTANQGCTITIDGSTFSIPDYQIIRDGAPDGVINDDVWAFLKGADQKISKVCGNRPETLDPDTLVPRPIPVDGC